MLKKILATYLSMVIIYQEQNIINMLNIFMHQTITKKLMKEEKKEEKQNTSCISVLFKWKCFTASRLGVSEFCHCSQTNV